MRGAFNAGAPQPLATPLEAERTKVPKSAAVEHAVVSLQRLDGSFRASTPHTHPGIAFEPDQRVRLTVWYHGSDGHDGRRAAARLGALPVSERTYDTRRALRERTDSASRAAEELERHCARYDVDVVARHWRSTTIRGRLADLVDAFGATVDLRSSPLGSTFRHRHDWLHLPPHLAREVHGVFGFDQWFREATIDKHQLIREIDPLAPHAVEKRYAFPDTLGRGQTIGILAYASSYHESDYRRAMERLGVRRADPIVTYIDDARDVRHVDDVGDLEAATDVQIAAALAPEARIVIYETPHDERGCLDAIRNAIFDERYAPSILSISYGMIERRWTPSALEILDELFIAAALVGVSVFVASGDNAAEVDERGNAHVNAPASSPFVIACGATTLKRETDGTTDEIAWHRSGGGFGRAEVPPWQTAAGDWAAKNGLRPGRGVPDVAAQCVPGYPVFFDRKELAMHGTSATAPFWAALAARINEATTRRYGPGATIGFFAPILYDRAGELMKPIVRGRNATFEAGHGWNPLSGLGIPNGKALEATFLRNG